MPDMGICTHIDKCLLGSGSAIHSASPKEISQPLDDSYNLGQDQPPTPRDSLKVGSDHLNTSLDEPAGPRNTARSRYITQPESRQNIGKTGSESVATYNPPSASRLLSLGRPPNSSNSAHPNTCTYVLTCMIVLSHNSA